VDNSLFADYDVTTTNKDVSVLFIDAEPERRAFGLQDLVALCVFSWADSKFKLDKANRVF
jgi:hypothetical protein